MTSANIASITKSKKPARRTPRPQPSRPLRNQQWRIKINFNIERLSTTAIVDTKSVSFIRDFCFAGHIIEQGAKARMAVKVISVTLWICVTCIDAVLYSVHSHRTGASITRVNGGLVTRVEEATTTRCMDGSVSTVDDQSTRRYRYNLLVVCESSCK